VGAAQGFGTAQKEDSGAFGWQTLVGARMKAIRTGRAFANASGLRGHRISPHCYGFDNEPGIDLRLCPVLWLV
jgi:hypothetical protein